MPSTKFDLQLTGYVGGWEFNSYDTQAFLKKNEGKHVDILIESIGGSTIEGVRIANQFSRHGDVTVHLSGWVASAATIAAMGAARVVMDNTAMFLIHKCSAEFFAWTMANSDEFEKMIEDIRKQQKECDSIDANIALLYSQKTGKSPEKMLALMSEERWLTAEETDAWGFADEIVKVEGSKCRPSEELKAIMSYAGVTPPSFPKEETVIDKIKAIFSQKDSTNVKSQNMDLANYPELKKAVGNEAEISSDLAQKLESALKSLSEKLESCNEEIEKLKKGAAEQQSTVVETKETQEKEESVESDFAAAYNGALELLKLI